jgi:D-glutamate N-acetyltransferase
MNDVTSPAAFTLRKPYLLFIGNAEDEADAKTACGLRDWARDACLAQLRLPQTQVDLGLPDMTPEAAARAGAGSMVVGVAPVGGGIPAEWESSLHAAVAAGLDVVSGMHRPLEGVPGLAEAARKRGVALVNVRLPRHTFPAATGRRRSGKRLLTVGTDCALGKKYTALALTEAMRARGIAADFRATGQTGILIAGGGIALDAVVADFAAGAAEMLSPDAAPDHWDVIEGQGSLFHPAYAGVTLALVHGSQPDVLILDFRIPDLRTAVARYLEAAQLTNPGARLGGVSLNTSMLDDTKRSRVLAETADRLGVPCFDPLQTPLKAALDFFLRR